MKFKGSTTNLAMMQGMLAALLFGLNSPFAKLLLGSIPPMFMAAFLYLGAALGMSAIWIVSRAGGKHGSEAGIARQDALWVVLMILLDIAAPFLLMWGLSLTSATNASLLANFEMVVTTVIAMFFFKEAVGIRLWVSIGIITAASIVLCTDFHQGGTFAFSPGSLLILCACLCWGLENNCTRCLSNKNPAQVVIVKGFGSGSISLLLALAMESMPAFRPVGISCALALGFVSYGLSIFLYVRAQRHLGAARTSMYYAAAPFFGALVSFLLLGERPGITFFIGAVLMAAGTVLAIYEKHSHIHRHSESIHEHRHSHTDGHHMHEHDSTADVETEHSHVHLHNALEHAHEHRPDEHHRHLHG